MVRSPATGFPSQVAGLENLVVFSSAACTLCKAAGIANLRVFSSTTGIPCTFGPCRRRLGLLAGLVNEGVIPCDEDGEEGREADRYEPAYIGDACREEHGDAIDESNDADENEGDEVIPPADPPDERRDRGEPPPFGHAPG